MKKIILCAMSIVALFDVCGMRSLVMSGSSSDSTATYESSTNIIKPVEKLDFYNPFNSAEFEFYNVSTWKQKETLSFNKEQLLTTFLLNCCSIDSTLDTKHRQVFSDALHKISDSPVGCKLFRILITKYWIGETSTKFSKIQVKTDSSQQQISLGYTTHLQQNFIHLIIPTEKSSEVYSTFGQRSTESKKVDFFEINPLQEIDCGIFGVLLKALHYISGIQTETVSTECIQKRLVLNEYPDKLQIISGRVSLIDRRELAEVDAGSIREWKANVKMYYVNDYQFRKECGFFVETGVVKFDPLNVSAYWYSTRSIVPLGFSCFFAGQEDYYFFEKYAELGHAIYYLGGYAKLPKFGIGQYAHIE